MDTLEGLLRAYKLVNGRIVPCEDMVEAAHWFSTGDRMIDHTVINDDCYVSTAFLSYNHSFDPERLVLFETMVFGGEWDGRQYRYETHAQAMRGHWQVVDALRQHRDPQVDCGERGIMDLFLSGLRELRKMGKLVEKALELFRLHDDKRLTPGNLITLLRDEGCTDEEVVAAFDALEEAGLIHVVSINGVKHGKLVKSKWGKRRGSNGTQEGQTEAGD